MKSVKSVTLDGSQYNAGVVVGDDVGVAILGFVHLQVGVLPRELLAWIDRLAKHREGVSAVIGGAEQ